MATSATVIVRGRASREVEPDYAVISTAIEATAAEQHDAMRQVARIADDLRDGIGATPGVRTFLLPQVRVQRNQRWDERRQTSIPTDWTASVSGNVECAREAAGALVALIGGAGAQVMWVSWEVDRANPNHREVRREAVADAVQAAEDFAAAVGRDLGPLLSLADEGLSSGSRDDSGPMLMRAAATAGGPRIDLDPQPQVLSAAVEATFALAE